MCRACLKKIDFLFRNSDLFIFTSLNCVPKMFFQSVWTETTEKKKQGHSKMLKKEMVFLSTLEWIHFISLELILDECHGNG